MTAPVNEYLAKRIEQIVAEADRLFQDVFECTDREYGMGCGNCMNTGINATCKEEFDFAVALHDLVVMGHRYMTEELTP